MGDSETRLFNAIGARAFVAVVLISLFSVVLVPTLATAQPFGAGPLDLRASAVDGVVVEPQFANPDGTGAFIVRFRDDALSKRGLVGDEIAATERLVDGLATRNGVLPSQVYSSVFAGFAADLTAAQHDALAADPAIASITPDTLMYLQGDQADPPWGLDRIDAVANVDDDNYHYDFDGTGVHLYVVDTGINSSHNDFTGRIGDGVDIIEGDTDPEDCAGHGTHVSSTAGGTEFGVAKNVTIHPVRVFPCGGSTPSSVINAGLDWIAANHVKPAVVNMSLGGTRAAQADSAVDALVELGITVVVAAGNSNTDACRQTPANEPGVITVGATTIDDVRSSFSNWGPCVDIFAPGSGIEGAWFGSPTASVQLNGTSMASPHVAGIVALLLEQHPTATPQQVMDLLLERSTRDQVSDPYLDSPNRLGHSLGFSDALPPSIEIQGDVRTVVTQPVSGAFELDGVDDAVFTPSGLPPGVALSPEGVFSGAPTARGRFAVEVDVASDGRGFYRRFQWHVASALNGAPELQEFAPEVTVLAGTDPRFWFHVNDPDLDFSGIAFTGPTVEFRVATDGQTAQAKRLQITDIVEGVHEVVVQAFDERGGLGPEELFTINAVASLDQVNPDPGLEPQPATEGVLGEPITLQLASVGDDANIVYGISQLPPGLSLDVSSGEILGTPEAIGGFEVRASISNLQGRTATQRFTLPIRLADPVVEPPSASVRAGCVGEDGALDVDLNNPTADPVTFQVAVSGQADRSVVVAAASVGAESYSVLDDQQYLIIVDVDDEPVLSVTETIACDPPVPEAEVTLSCLNEDGRIDIAVTNINDEFTVYKATFNGRLARAVGLAPRFGTSLKITGRPEGDIVVNVFRNEELVLTETATVACDVIEPIEIMVSCLAGNGRIDVDVFNDGASQALYNVRVGALNPRVAFLAPGFSKRFTVTGRRDGTLPVVVSINAEPQTFNAEVDCDPDDPAPPPPTDDREVAVSVGCLAGNGRIDVYLTNPLDVSATYVVVVGSLGPRERVIPAGDQVRVTVTGRRDDVYDVRVARDSVEVANQPATVSCDD